MTKQLSKEELSQVDAAIELRRRCLSKVHERRPMHGFTSTDTWKACDFSKDELEQIIEGLDPQEYSFTVEQACAGALRRRVLDVGQLIGDCDFNSPAVLVPALRRAIEAIELLQKHFPETLEEEPTDEITPAATATLRLE